MSIITDAELLAQIEDFLGRVDMPPTRFGREVMADGALVQHLRAGRSLSLANAGKVIAFMRDYRPTTDTRAAA
jgi:hypothetical protein